MHENDSFHLNEDFKFVVSQITNPHFIVNQETGERLYDSDPDEDLFGFPVTWKKLKKVLLKLPVDSQRKLWYYDKKNNKNHFTSLIIDFVRDVARTERDGITYSIDAAQKLRSMGWWERLDSYNYEGREPISTVPLNHAQSEQPSIPPAADKKEFDHQNSIEFEEGGPDGPQATEASNEEVVREHVIIHDRATDPHGSDDSLELKLKENFSYIRFINEEVEARIEPRLEAETRALKAERDAAISEKEAYKEMSRDLLDVIKTLKGDSSHSVDKNKPESEFKSSGEEEVSSNSSDSQNLSDHASETPDSSSSAELKEGLFTRFDSNGNHVDHSQPEHAHHHGNV